MIWHWKIKGQAEVNIHNSAVVNTITLKCGHLLTMLTHYQCFTDFHSHTRVFRINDLLVILRAAKPITWRQQIHIWLLTIPEFSTPTQIDPRSSASTGYKDLREVVCIIVCEKQAEPCTACSTRATRFYFTVSSFSWAEGRRPVFPAETSWVNMVWQCTFLCFRAHIQTEVSRVSTPEKCPFHSWPGLW